MTMSPRPTKEAREEPTLRRYWSDAVAHAHAGLLMQA
jgi:hypothetical protein